MDTHVHVIDPDHFRYVPGHGYHPGPDETGPYPKLRRVLGEHEVDGALLVQPSCYGTDNAALLDALGRDLQHLRGIAVVADDVAESELIGLRAAGVVGVRFNLQQSDPHRLAEASVGRLLRAVTELDWFVEVFAQGEAWTRLGPVLAASGVTVLVDHFGSPSVERGVDQEGFRAVCELGRESPAAVKISAPYRMSAHPPTSLDSAPSLDSPAYPDLRPYVEALILAFGPDRVVWGSDWPFINAAVRPSYVDPAELLAGWGVDTALGSRILCDNPARLFGFGS